MIIDRNLSRYIILNEETIGNALRKIDENEDQIIFAINNEGILRGVLTDGDFRRWLIDDSVDSHDLGQPVERILNTDFIFAKTTDEPVKIASHLSNRIRFVPILDGRGRLNGIARERTRQLSIEGFVLNADTPTFVIAEIGNNHNGDIELARRLVDAAVEAGASCAKFQMRDLTSLYRNTGQADDTSEDLGSQYTLDLLARFQLSSDELLGIFNYCRKVGIIPLCTPWDIPSFDLLETYGMSAYKVASADLTNHDLLDVMARSGKPLICSTGMSTEEEIAQSVQLLKERGTQYVLMHCNSTYPAPFKDIQLRFMDQLQEIGDCLVGYSGHERGISIVLAAVARGAKVIEKHLTLDRSLEGNDHRVSLLPCEFARMVEGIREIELSLCDYPHRVMSQGEIINREVLGKSLIINRDLAVGELITADMVEVKSPGKGLQPNFKQKLIGRTAQRTFRRGDFFYKSDLEPRTEIRTHFTFSRLWGVPVRYHDIGQITDTFNADILEFHLSYKDMEEDVHHYFAEPLGLRLVVHSPELFKGDHLLDLCSSDDDYRRASIAELQRVVETTRALNEYFPKSSRPLIVVNVGGFTQDRPLDRPHRRTYYDRLAESLDKIDRDRVELIPQTMPPFPWLFGGQRYHNLFIDPEECAAFCGKHGMRICFDTSHSKLACNHFKWSLTQFVECVGPFIAHVHLVDAKGVDGEGLQIGTGEIDFHDLGRTLKDNAPGASFVPEVWQGHKNNGEGFRIALDRLMQYGFY